MTTRGVAGLAGLLALLTCGVARADTVTSKGTVLKGKVTGVTSAGLTFEPEYGKGSIAIDWKDVEDVKTDGAFQVLYGADGRTDAPLQGVSAGNLLVGATADSATPVPTADIVSGVGLGADGATWQDDVRSTFRFWDGHFDLGFNLQQATTDTLGFSIGMETTRKNGPTKWLIGANYRFGTSTPQNQPKSVIEDRAFGVTRLDYDLTDRWYAFGSFDATYDAIQKLSIRTVPKLGAGYKIWEEKINADKTNFLSGEAGIAYVYEKYFVLSRPPKDSDYFSVAFGAAAGYWLPYDAHAGWRMDYLPAVNDWGGNYLLRNAIDLTVPVFGPVGAKLSFLDEYNSRPAGTAENNALYLTIGLTVGW
ncbi:MAG: DUF481 domain-containing protein [Deltaproteobacteria bacterium]|nr:DUF481 domain-containing protein [Deltaproteobacteria bacterium]